MAELTTAQLNAIIHAVDRVTATVIASGGGISNKVPYTGATADVDLGLFGLTTSKITLSPTTVGTPANGNFYYTTAATTGFNFYSNDATNTGNIATFANSVNSFGLYMDTTAVNGLILLYAQSATRFGFAANAGATVNYEMSPTGNHSWVGGTNTSGSIGSFLFTAGTKTNQTLSTAISAFRIVTGTIQWATGALAATQSFVNISQPTMSFVGASTSTLAATLSIVGGVIAGTNAAITTNSALLIASGAVGAGTVTSYGILSNAQSGATNNYSAGFFGGLGVLISASNIVTDTTTGMKIGTATTQKIAFWNVTPDVQPTTAIVGAAFAANTSGLGDGSATYGGYTGGQIVAALKRVGILA